MRPSIKSVLKAFSIELPLYTALMLGYGFLVLHFLGKWLAYLFHQERKTYAGVALLLIIGQGFVLEICGRALLVFVTGKREK
jgi:hypothetical protein